MALNERGQAAPAARAWGVAALLLAASDALQARLGSVTVRGELSGFMRAASGHCYFTLKDSDGQTAALRCAMFRRAAGLLDFRPADGQQVELRGRITVYEARGELQCVVEAMQPLGAGSLYELFLRMKARLAADGLFDAERKRALPAYPAVLGLVTSASGAALHDVLSAVARRAPQVRVVLYPSLVQGADAPAQLVQAIATANARAEVDALIVCRGGGSLEDLWAFNDEAVVRAIAASALPVVCGVGHETDVTLAELAADLRAPTPTAAAELATPVQADELARLQALSGRLQAGLRRRLDQQAQRLDRVAFQLGRPARALAPQALLLARSARRMSQALGTALHRQQRALPLLAGRLQQAQAQQRHGQAEALARLALRLDANDPGHVLARGYAWMSDAAGRPVTRAGGLQPGQRLRAHWTDGSVPVDVAEALSSQTAGPRALAAQGDPPAQPGPAAQPGPDAQLTDLAGSPIPADVPPTARPRRRRPKPPSPD